MSELARRRLSWPAADRPLAQALVWLRMARHRLAACPPAGAPFRAPRRAVEAERRRAVECFERCLGLAPALRPAYEELAAAQDE